MTTALNLLAEFEANVQASDNPESYFGGEFAALWLEGDLRARLQNFLLCLGDLPCVLVQMWATGEVAFTFRSEGKSLWVSHNGRSFHIWRNFGYPEAMFELANNVVLDDTETDGRTAAIQVIREYFRPALVEAA